MQAIRPAIDQASINTFYELNNEAQAECHLHSLQNLLNRMQQLNIPQRARQYAEQIHPNEKRQWIEFANETDITLQEITNKIDKIQHAYHPFSSASPSPQHPTIQVPLPVGFSNFSANNCWLNSLMHLLLEEPYLHIYTTIAKYHQYDNLGNPSHGQVLLQVLDAYQNSLQSQTSIPTDLVKALRTALAAILQGQISSTISPNSSIQEDSQEALSLILGHYEEIASIRPELCQSYLNLPNSFKLLATKWVTFNGLPNTKDNLFSIADQPLEMTQLLIDLPPENISRETKLEQIWMWFINKPQQKELTVPLNFEELLMNTIIKRNASEDDPFNKLMQDGQQYSLKPWWVCWQFEKAPEELVISLKRFTPFGKNSRPVLMPIQFTLDKNATHLNEESVHYGLDFFIVHTGSSMRGGHYIAYKKINDQWFELNDASRRFVNNQEIQAILNTQKPGYTSYLHRYKKQGAIVTQPTMPSYQTPSNLPNHSQLQRSSLSLLSALTSTAPTQQSTPLPPLGSTQQSTLLPPIQQPMTQQSAQQPLNVPSNWSTHTLQLIQNLIQYLEANLRTSTPYTSITQETAKKYYETLPPELQINLVNLFRAADVDPRSSEAVAIIKNYVAQLK